MDTTRMRRIEDRWGALACCLLRGHLLLKQILGIEGAPRRSPETIVLVKFFGIGSIVLATPMMRALRRRFPRARLVFLTFEANREILEKLSFIDEVITLRHDSFRHLLTDVLAARRRLKALDVDAAIAFEFFVKFSTILAYLSGAPRRFGFMLGDGWRDSLLTDRVFLNVYRHVSEIFASLVRPLGVEVADWSIEPLRARGESADAVRARLADAVGKRLVCVNVNAGELSAERRWPLARFGELLDRLLAAFPTCAFALIGTCDEREYMAPLLARFEREPRVLDFAGKLSLDELIALLTAADLLVTNDSGPLHLAEATGLATVSLFGPETPVLYGPRGPGHTVIWKQVECSPCLNAYMGKMRVCQGENRCMTDISVDEVFNATRDALGGD